MTCWCAAELYMFNGVPLRLKQKHIKNTCPGWARSSRKIKFTVSFVLDAVNLLTAKKHKRIIDILRRCGL